MKSIFYILSVLVIAAAAYFAFDNKNKLEGEMSLFEETQTTNQNVAASIKTTQTKLDDTTEALKKSKAKNAELIAQKESEESKERNLRATIEKYETEIEDANAELVKFEEAQKKINEILPGGITFEEIPEELRKLDVQRKDLQKQFEELEVTILGLEKAVSGNKEEITRQTERLVEMRQRIARNSVQGRITAVDPVWGFVVVNLGEKNSNIRPESDLLVYRDGRLLGRLDIQSIEPTQTISDIDLENLRPGQRIRTGDTVILAKSAGN